MKSKRIFTLMLALVMTLSLLLLAAAAGSQRQSHYQCERQCKQLLHSSFAPFHFFQDVSGKKPNS